MTEDGRSKTHLWQSIDRLCSVCQYTIDLSELLRYVNGFKSGGR